MKKNKKDILNELNSADTGFSVPDNYFDQFEKDLQENREKRKPGFVAPEEYFDVFEEKILFRLRTKAKTTTGFKTPDNYFNKIDQRTLDNISIEKPHRIIKLNSNKFLKIISYAIAASLLLFFSLKSFKSGDKVFDIETIEISEIESWMDEDLISFSSYDISETFDDIYLYGEDNYTEDEILDYLEGENIENLILEN